MGDSAAFNNDRRSAPCPEKGRGLIPPPLPLRPEERKNPYCSQQNIPYSPPMFSPASPYNQPNGGNSNRPLTSKLYNPGGFVLNDSSPFKGENGEPMQNVNPQPFIPMPMPRPISVHAFDSGSYGTMPEKPLLYQGFSSPDVEGLRPIGPTYQPIFPTVNNFLNNTTPMRASKSSQPDFFNPKIFEKLNITTTPQPSSSKPLENIGTQPQSNIKENNAPHNNHGPTPPTSSKSDSSQNNRTQSPNETPLKYSTGPSSPNAVLSPTSQTKAFFRPQHTSRYSFSHSTGQRASIDSNVMKPIFSDPGLASDDMSLKPSKFYPARGATLATMPSCDSTDPLGLEDVDEAKLSDQGKLVLALAKREFQFTRSVGAIEKLITRRIQTSSIFTEETKKEAIEAILGNLPDLLASHRQFVGELAIRIKSNTKNYAEAFSRRIDGFTQFVYFAKAMPTISSYLKTTVANSPKFGLWLKDLERHPAFGNLTVKDFLKRVQSHLGTYTTFLNDIYEVSSDKPLMEMVTAAFQDMVTDINSVAGIISPPSPAAIDPDGVNWSSSVSESDRKSVEDQEVKRQEAIFEFIKAEREYVQDLHTIQEIFIEGIRSSTAFSIEHHDVVVYKLFFNAAELMAIHDSVSSKLDERQLERAVVDRIGDILLPWSQQLDPYKLYSARVRFALEFCTKERISNPKFELLLRECEQHKASRRLTLDSFISMPTRRLARYPLHLKEILKRTPANHPDEANLRATLTQVERRLALIDRTKGETDSKLRLRAISDRLEVHPQHVSLALDLDAPLRQLVSEGYLKLLKGPALLKAFLLDHCILLAKEHELGEDLFEYESYRKPIELNNIIVIGELSSKIIQANMSSGFFESVFSGGPTPPSPSLCFSIFDGATSETLIFSASTPREKEEWVTLILGESNRVKSREIKK